MSGDYPEIKNNYKQIFSTETAFQMTSILEGVVLRGTAKKLKDLKLNIAGKTGTTNKNTDTWFIGFTSNVLVGVYVGSDNPMPLGKYETGSKTAMPIFREFVKKLAVPSAVFRAILPVNPSVTITSTNPSVILSPST